MLLFEFPKKKDFKGTEIISSYAEFCLISQYMEMEEEEKKLFKRFEEVLKDFPVYTEYLVKIKGVGPAMAGVIISEFDIAKAKYASSLQKYCGIDVVLEVDAEDPSLVTGVGRSRKEKHLREI